MQKMKLTREPLLDAKYQSFDFQKDAVDFIKELEYGAIFHEQGLGKTKIAIDIILYWLEKEEIDTVMIVTKKGLIQNWINELKIHTHLTPAVLTNNKNENFFIFNGPSRVVLTNFEVFPIEIERFNLYLKSRNVAIIIDESTKIKNPNTKISESLFKLSSLFVKRIIMTGTPVSNRPYDIWSQIFFLDRGNSLGNDYFQFKKDYDLINELYENIDKRDKFEIMLTEIYSKISDFAIRETKQSGFLKLPQKNFVNVYAEFEKEQLKLYNTVKSEFILFIEDAENKIDDSSEIIKRLLRLIQLASNPSLVVKNYNSIPGKLLELEKILEVISNKNEKCIVWTSFVENVNWLHGLLQKYQPVKIHGKMNIEERNRSIKKFVDQEEIRILIATPQSSKEGLTLTVANNAIFFDKTLSLDDYLQAQDRIHRISQEKICNIYSIIMKDSIDEWVDSLLLSKDLAAKLLQGDISIEEYKKDAKYDYSEILKNIIGEVK